MSGRKFTALLAFAFGVVFAAALLVFVAVFPDPTEQQFEVIRVVLALAAGGIASMIPGLLNLNLKAASALSLRASGALAAFALVYFYSPAHWSHTEPHTILQRTSGAGSPAIIGNGNAVNVSQTASDDRK